MPGASKWPLEHTLGHQGPQKGALWVAFESSRSTIRSDVGYSDIFETLLGTKEGGVKAPLLSVLIHLYSFIYEYILNSFIFAVP